MAVHRRAARVGEVPGARRGVEVSPRERRRGATLIHVSTRPERWPDWLQAAGVEHPRPRQGPQLPTTALALEAAEAGLGTALANRLFAAPHLSGGRLAVAFDIDLATGRGYYMVHPPDHAGRAPVAAFRRWLSAAAVP